MHEATLLAALLAATDVPGSHAEGQLFGKPPHAELPLAHSRMAPQPSVASHVDTADRQSEHLLGLQLHMSNPPSAAPELEAVLLDVVALLDAALPVDPALLVDPRLLVDATVLVDATLLLGALLLEATALFELVVPLEPVALVAADDDDDEAIVVLALSTLVAEFVEGELLVTAFEVVESALAVTLDCPGPALSAAPDAPLGLSPESAAHATIEQESRKARHARMEENAIGIRLERQRTPRPHLPIGSAGAHSRRPRSTVAIASHVAAPRPRDRLRFVRETEVNVNSRRAIPTRVDASARDFAVPGGRSARDG
jgi:hypothetical protein